MSRTGLKQHYFIPRVSYFSPSLFALHTAKKDGVKKIKLSQKFLQLFV